MIGRLTGRIYSSGNDLLIDVAGVGYVVSVSEKTKLQLPAEGETVTLEVTTCVKQESIELVGFLEPIEKQLFHLLTSVSGIGTRTALSVLSGFAPEELASAITSNNIAAIQEIQGIGKKTSERLVLELRDKIAKLPIIPSRHPAGDRQVMEEALSALINLGYHRTVAEKAVLRAYSTPCPDVGKLIRDSLKVIAL